MINDIAVDYWLKVIFVASVIGLICGLPGCM
jgi:hypothetical protein